MESDGYDIYEYLDQGVVISLKPSDFDTVVNPTASLLAALDEFSPIFRPLTAELTVCCVDPEWRFPEYSMEVEQPFWFIYTSWLPKHLLDNQYINPVTEEVSAIAIDTLTEWITRACDQKCVSCQEYPVDWEELLIHTTCAQVFEIEKFAGRKSLKMQCAERPGNIIDVPIRRDGDQLWVWGPDQTMQDNIAAAPFRVRLSLEFVALHLEVHWALWAEPEFAGFQAICQTVQRLIDRGWKISFASEPFSKVFEVQPD